jgi:hypothetical protein
MAKRPRARALFILAASAAIGPVGCSKSGGGAADTIGAASVLERNNHPSRDGLFVQPTLTKATAARMAMDATFNATFTGTMFASPLYVEKGPGGKGVFFAVTTNNDVFALDETTGATVWTRNIGPAPTANGVDCGRIHPLGILGTPVIDGTTRTLFLSAAVGTTQIDRHEVHALSIDDGSERAGWPVDLTKVTAGTVTFTAPPQNQRSALSLVGGIVYVAFGGHAGDCGPYHGWVIGIDAKNPASIGGWASGGVGEGIWAPGGMASDGNGVFAVTGNATGGATDHLDSEEVVRVTGLGTLDRSTTANFYYPAMWHYMDANDQDFAASSPVYVPVPGATPPAFVVALSKMGHMYLLDAKKLGGMGGEVVDYAVGTIAFTAPTVYTTAAGVHVGIYASGVQCPGGGAGGVVSVLIPPGAPPVPQVAWCANTDGGGSPITTSTDAKTDAILWFISGDKLNGVDGDTGQVIYDGGTDSCPSVEHWTSPIAVKGRIIIGADGRLCSWSPH